MKKKILISDIAADLGISVTTVSFILNGKAKEKRISDSLTQRVLEHVQKVGYKPNELAKSLRTGKTKIIGLIVEDISNPFFANIARHIENLVYSKGYRILYCSTDNKSERAIELIHLFKDRHVDGYIITPTDGLEATIQSLQSSHVPLVLFDRFVPEVKTNYVVTDNEKGSYELTKHLIQNGFKRVAFVTLYSNQTQMRDRLNGYMHALDDHKMQSYIIKINREEGEESNKKDFLAFYQDILPDAVIFSTNYLAIAGIDSLQEQQIALPGIASYDDHVLFKLCKPSITAIAQPLELIAEKVIQVLLHQLEGGHKEIRQIELPSTLIVRESSMQTR
jgi:LacI family transcriptional regulator